MEPVDADTFEALVSEELDRLPEWLAEAVDNVVVMIEDSHPEGLLGLWEGIALTERDQYGGMVMPDRVTIYRLPICEICADVAEVVDEVGTLVRPTRDADDRRAVDIGDLTGDGTDCARRR